MTHSHSNNVGSIIQALEHQSTIIGESTAFLQKVRGIWVSLTWSEYFTSVAEVGEGLVELGIGVGDKVVTLLSNCTALVSIDIATQSIGAVSVPLIIETRPDEVLRLIAELEPKAIAVQTTSWLDLVLEARSTGLISMDTKVVFVDSAGVDSYVEESLFSYQELRKLGRSGLQEIPTRFNKRFGEIDKSMVATCVVSSGSTGLSSIYSFSHSQVVEASQSVAAQFPLQVGEIILSQCPYGAPGERAISIYSAIFTGAIVAFPESQDSAVEAALEILPQFVHSPVQFLQQVTTTSQRRLERNHGLKRLITRQWQKSIKRSKNQRSGFVGNLLVGRFLVKSLGLQRSRWVISSGSQLQKNSIDFFHELGVNLVDVFTTSRSFGPVMLASSAFGNFDKLMPGVNVSLTDPNKQMVLSGSSISATVSHQVTTNDLIEMSDDVIRWFGHPIITGNSWNFHDVLIESCICTSRVISRAIVCHSKTGEPSLILEVDAIALADWATSLNVPFTTVASLIDVSTTQDFISSEVQIALMGLSDKILFDSLLVMRRSMSIDSGELTATGKPRRYIIGSIVDGIIITNQ
jgi:long-chain acyl-CoA synthetase